MQMLFVGFALIFVYIAAVLGRWNSVEQRVRIIFLIQGSILPTKSLNFEKQFRRNQKNLNPPMYLEMSENLSVHFLGELGSTDF